MLMRSRRLVGLLGVKGISYTFHKEIGLNGGKFLFNEVISQLHVLIRLIRPSNQFSLC